MSVEFGRWPCLVLVICGGFVAVAAQAGELSAIDMRFIKSAEAALSPAIVMSQMAPPRTSNLAVKTYAASVVDDYHKADLEMLALSDIDPASALVDPAVEKERQGLTALADHAFERRYLTAMVKYHQQAMALFQKQLGSLSNPRLKELVDVTLARLSTHLDQAKSLLTARPPS
jgi:predicted outer membrane protein